MKSSNPTVDVYIDLNEIYYMEKAVRPDTSLVMLGDERFSQTILALRNGKTFVVLDTPDEILGKILEIDPFGL